jgi:hypothetical protein
MEHLFPLAIRVSNPGDKREQRYHADDTYRPGTEDTSSHYVLLA